MKNIFSSRRNKSPHNKEETEKKEAPFFSKESKTPFFSNVKGAPVQAKLTVGQPGDKYEKEADSMADAVVNKRARPEIQNKEISSIQRESLATPLEDEKLGTAEQRMEEDKLVQEKPELQRMEEPEEEMVQQMEGDEEEGMVNKMENEEEESVQAKSNGKSSTASPGLSQQIKSKSGKGRSMSKSTQSEMESSFNTDFSEVNIHSDHDAVKMNKELGAQAFTHGKDVYFNSGKYSPETTEGKRLLAHELTHVVQQVRSINKNIQRSLFGEFCPDDPAINNTTVQGYINAALAQVGSIGGTPDSSAAFHILRTQRESDCCNYDLAAAEQYMYARSEVATGRSDPYVMRMMVLGYGGIKLIDMIQSGDCPTTRTSFAQVGWGLDGVSHGVADRARSTAGSTSSP